MSNLSLTSEEFKNIYSRVPRLCVEVVIKTDEGYLLTKRAIPPCEGQWHLPGGTVLYKESLEDALKRVAKAELGVNVEVGEFLGYMEFLHFDEMGGYDHPISLAFLCTPDHYDFTLDVQASEYAFFKEIPENTLAEQKEFLRKHLAKH